MGCLKLTYSQKEKPIFWEVWKNPESAFQGVDWYDYGARFYDPALGRWHVIDPAIENNHYEWTPYAYVYNNPIKSIDPLGLDSAQRATAVAMAEKYVENNSGNTYPNQSDIKKGKFRGKPGEKVDCSGMVSNCMMKADEPDPYTDRSGNGVSRIVKASEKVKDEDNVEVGNAITLDNSASGKDNPMGHIGIIVEVKRNDKGETTGYKIVDSGGKPSSGKSGPRYTNIKVGGNGYWDKRVSGVYKWDKKPETINGGTLKSVTVTGKGNSYIKPIITTIK